MQFPTRIKKMYRHLNIQNYLIVTCQFHVYCLQVHGKYKEGKGNEECEEENN